MPDDTFWGLSSTGWTGITALLTGCLLLTAVVAAFYAAGQVKVARDQADETRKAQAEASRPYVVVTVESAATGSPLFDLVVKNIGQRPAVEVSISLDPPPLRASEPPGYELAKVKMLNEPVAMVAPGQELRTHYDSQGERRGRDDLPTSHRVALRYRDTSGHKYAETAVLDLDALQGTLYGDVKTIHHLGKSLADIAKTLKAASALGKSGALSVNAAVEHKADRDRRLTDERKESMRRRRRALAALGETAPDGPDRDLLSRARGNLDRAREKVRDLVRRHT